jgi:hypothetical protein
MEDNNELITQDLLTGDASDNNIVASDEARADSKSETTDTSTNSGSISLEEIEQALGKKFPNKETALKAFKDTFSYVGKKKDSIAEEVKKEFSGEQFITREQYEKDMFYSRNPEYNDPSIQKVIEAISVTEKIPVSEVVKTDTFKDIFGSVSGFKKSQEMKSVLESNPRIASSKSKLSEGKDLVFNGDSAQKEAGRDLITRAVLEALDK